MKTAFKERALDKLNEMDVANKEAFKYVSSPCSETRLTCRQAVSPSCATLVFFTFNVCSIDIRRIGLLSQPSPSNPRSYRSHQARSMMPQVRGKLIRFASLRPTPSKLTRFLKRFQFKHPLGTRHRTQQFHRVMCNLLQKKTVPVCALGKARIERVPF